MLTSLLSQHAQIMRKLLEGKNDDLLILYFAKVFDIVDHSILVTLMSRKGISKRLLK